MESSYNGGPPPAIFFDPVLDWLGTYSQNPLQAVYLLVMVAILCGIMWLFISAIKKMFSHFGFGKNK